MIWVLGADVENEPDIRQQIVSRLLVLIEQLRRCLDLGARDRADVTHVHLNLPSSCFLFAQLAKRVNYRPENCIHQQDIDDDNESASKKDVRSQPRCMVSCRVVLLDGRAEARRERHLKCSVHAFGQRVTATINEVHPEIKKLEFGESENGNKHKRESRRHLWYSFRKGFGDA